MNSVGFPRAGQMLVTRICQLIIPTLYDFQNAYLMASAVLISFFDIGSMRIHRAGATGSFVERQ
jgi:hypothetical protein